MINTDEILIAIDKMDSLLRLSLELLLTSTNVIENSATEIIEKQCHDPSQELFQNIGAFYRSITNKNVVLFSTILKIINFERRILSNVLERFINNTDMKRYFILSRTLAINPSSYSLLDSGMHDVEIKFGGVRSTLYGCHRNCQAYYEKYKNIRSNLVLSISELARIKSRKYAEHQEDTFQSMVMGIILAVDKMKVNKLSRQKNAALKFIRMYMKGATKFQSDKEILFEDMSNIPSQLERVKEPLAVLSKMEKYIVGLLFLDPTVGKPPSQQDIAIEKLRQSI